MADIGDPGEQPTVGTQRCAVCGKLANPWHTIYAKVHCEDCFEREINATLALKHHLEQKVKRLEVEVENWEQTFEALKDK